MSTRAAVQIEYIITNANRLLICRVTFPGDIVVFIQRFDLGRLGYSTALGYPYSAA